MKLKNRVALITGGSTGIGRAAAVAMAREGANIALTARRAERCEEAVAEIEELGGQALALPGDVANAEHVAGLVAATVERWGRLDIVVPNAGITGSSPPSRTSLPRSGTRRTTSTCAAPSSPLNTPSPTCAQPVAAASSSSPRSTATASSPTSASPRIPAPRPAQVTFAKMAAVELAQWDIRINVVCPGATKTSIRENTFPRDIDKIRIPREFPQGMIPLQQRAASAEEVANAILFLASDEASYITGTEMYVDGALSLFQG